MKMQKQINLTTIIQASNKLQLSIKIGDKNIYWFLLSNQSHKMQNTWINKDILKINTCDIIK